MFYILPDDFKLNKDQADYVKLLRCGEVTHSWRSVARHFTRKNPDFVINYDLMDIADRDVMLEHFSHTMSDDEKSVLTKWENGHQLLGMDLCKAAMLFFNETETDGWN